MYTSEIRNLNYNQLKRELESSHEELFNLRFRASTKQLTDYRQLNKTRKKIARLKTIINEMESSRS